MFNFIHLNVYFSSWSKSLVQLDKKYGIGTERGSASSYEIWVLHVETEVMKAQERIWRAELGCLGMKSSLRHNLVFKRAPGVESLYDGTWASGLLFQIRTGFFHMKSFWELVELSDSA